MANEKKKPVKRVVGLRRPKPGHFARRYAGSRMVDKAVQLPRHDN